MGIVSAIILAVAIIVGVSAHFITKKPNSEPEQIAEEVIKAETGMAIDFSHEDLVNHNPD